MFHTKNKNVSVIINCYNGSEHLIRALKSLSAQTYNDFEVVFWDNKSFDNSVEIAESFNEIPICVFRAKQHTVLYEARNLAIAKCNGNFIAFLDVDDEWLPDKLEKQLKHFSDPNVGLVYSNYLIFDQDEDSIKIAHKQQLPNGKILNHILKEYVVGMSTVIFRRTVLDQIGFFNSSFNFIGDFDFVTRYAKCGVVGVCQDPLAIYHEHQRNLSKLGFYEHTQEIKRWINENKDLRSKLVYLKIRVIKRKVKFWLHRLKIGAGDR